MCQDDVYRLYILGTILLASHNSQFGSHMTEKGWGEEEHIATGQELVDGFVLSGLDRIYPYCSGYLGWSDLQNDHSLSGGGRGKVNLGHTEQIINRRRYVVLQAYTHGS